MLKFLRRLLFLGLLAAVAYGLWKRLAATSAAGPVDLSRPVPAPPIPVAPPPVPTASMAAAPRAATSTSPWIEPDEGACPMSHPIKAKLTSGIFHVPGGQNYDRTKADRCYVDASTAEADGLRQAKR